jgi:hypothetical protein
MRAAAGLVAGRRRAPKKHGARNSGNGAATIRFIMLMPDSATTEPAE